MQTRQLLLILGFRFFYDISPTPMAIGMVIATANVPQGFLSSACKTTIESPAIVIVIINNIANPVQNPATGPSSSLATSEKDFPSLLIDAKVQQNHEQLPQSPHQSIAKVNLVSIRIELRRLDQPMDLQLQ